jgi:5-methylcytosine-specific restriction endonuclease McrA
MKRLKRPRHQYAAGLKKFLTAEEQHRFGVAIERALLQSRVFARSSPRLAHVATRVSAGAGKMFLKAWDSNRTAVASFKDAVRNNSQTVRCPYCGLNRADTLDHFVEKALVPELALFARNLVPCCSECNRIRGRTFEKPSGVQRVLQFYDDPIERMGTLLMATVDFQEPDTPVLRFRTLKTRNSLAEPYRRHFKTLRLEERFKREAAGLLARLRGQFRGKGAGLVKQLIKSDLLSTNRRDGVNCVTSAVLRAILRSSDLLRWVRNGK